MVLAVDTGQVYLTSGQVCTGIFTFWNWPVLHWAGLEPGGQEVVALCVGPMSAIQVLCRPIGAVLLLMITPGWRRVGSYRVEPILTGCVMSRKGDSKRDFITGHCHWSHGKGFWNKWCCHSVQTIGSDRQRIWSNHIFLFQTFGMQTFKRSLGLIFDRKWMFWKFWKSSQVVGKFVDNK